MSFKRGVWEIFEAGRPYVAIIEIDGARSAMTGR
jgi:hypothetical protein